MTTALSAPLLVLGLVLVHASSGNPEVGGAYLAFVGALAVWGWIELAFLTGVIAGPERRSCPDGLAPGPRFLRAWWTVAYHELALLAGLLAIAFLTRAGPNEVALWTYLLLFVARILAKLNLFFGVPRINTEFVPDPLRHLNSYFRMRPVTAMFPLSITILTFATACFLHQLWAAGTDGAAVGAALLSALSVLALAEHWFMVVPLRDARLWRWMLPARDETTPKEIHPHGL